MRRRHFSTIWILLAAGLASHAAAQQNPSDHPALSIEQSEGMYRLFVETETAEGGRARVLLRETPAPPEPVASGRDPAARAAFVNWVEQGQLFSVYSRNGGASWSAPLPLKTSLSLRDGSVGPADEMPFVPADLQQPSGARLHLVQFKTVSLPEWRMALSDLGVEVFSYFPHNAHLVRMAPARAGQVAGLSFVERVEPFHPQYRMEESLHGLSRVAEEGEQKRVRVMALEWGPQGKARIKQFAAQIGARLADSWDSGHILELWVTPDQLRLLAGHDDVVWIDPWFERETDMDLVREDSGTDWYETDSGICGEGVRGEVMDSGIQQDHMDFDGLLIHGPAPDVQAHGTSTYGVVFGNGNRDGDGQAQGTGHMPCAEQGIFADFGHLTDRFVHTQELKNSPYYASFQSNSWGNGSVLSYNSYSHEVDDIIWRLDIAITQSQGNTGDQTSRSQAWAKNVISVGAIRHYDTLFTADDAWSASASIGPAEDGRIKPDLCYWYDSIYTTTTGNTYNSNFGGTSASTPAVAGILGLMLRMWADNVWQTDPTGATVFEKQPHFSTIKALLINNANQYAFTGTTSDLTRIHQGWGRPNLTLAKQRAATSFIVDQEEPLQLGGSATYEVVVAAAESDLKVTMVYPDPPGTTSSSLHRINDLNLRVTSPSAVEYHGNVGLDAGTVSTPGGSPNDVDTVENVFIENPEDGTWTVVVEAAEVNQDAHLATPEDDATFALVVTGAVLDEGACQDVDGDGRTDCDGDCDDSSNQVWSAPSEVVDVRFDPDKETLRWDPPLLPGGVSVWYDTIRSDDAADFATLAACVETDDGTDLLALDSQEPSPGSAYHYLVRAENGCPSGQGSLGSGNGEPRSGRSCP